MNNIALQILLGQLEQARHSVKHHSDGLKSAKAVVDDIERAVNAVRKEFGLKDNGDHPKGNGAINPPITTDEIIDVTKYGGWSDMVELILSKAERPLTTLDIAREATRRGAPGSLKIVLASVRYALQRLKKASPKRAVLERGHGRHPLWKLVDVAKITEAPGGASNDAVVSGSG